MKIDRALLFFLVAIVITAFLLLLGAVRWGNSAPSDAQLIVLFTAVATLIIFLLLRKVKTQTVASNNFALVSFYLLSIFAKFILAGIAVFLMLKEDPAAADSNVVFFMVCYVAFTFLEVVALLSIRTNS